MKQPKPTATTRLADLQPDPANRRTHPARNLAMTVEALQAVGAARSIVIDEDNLILAGNGVTAAAAEAGITKVQIVDAAGDTLVAVRRTGLTAAQKRVLALYDNRTAELAEWNIEQLTADLQNGEELTAFFLPDELTALLGDEVKRGKTDPDAIPSPRATMIAPGDLFTLGAHRLLCGDATRAADVARVMGADRASLCLTDPPYSVNYSISFSKRAGGHDAGRQMAHHESSDPTKLLNEFLRACPVGLLVMTFPVDRHLFALAGALRAADYVTVRELIWVKDAATFHPGATYQQQHEPILICRRSGVKFPNTVPAEATTVIQSPRVLIHSDHPTEKPQSVWLSLLEWHSVTRDIVFDPFSGSGGTIMACEQLSRSTRALEIEPTYCQVTIDRWEAFTGEKAVKVGADARA